MSFPEGRLRAADPARAMSPQPDDRAERDLALLLAEPRPTAHRPARPVAARRAPILITALVAAVVVATTVSVLAVVHPRSDVPATPGPTACATTGQEALLCGTYRSTTGTGDVAFLAAQPYALLFTREAGLTMLLSSACDTLQRTIRISGDQLEPGDGGGTQAGCSAEAERRHRILSDHLDTSGIRYTLRGDALVLRFEPGGATATFVRTVLASAAPRSPVPGGAGSS